MRIFKFTLILFLACFITESSVASTVLGNFEEGETQNLAIGTKWHDPEKFVIEPSIGENSAKGGINTSDKVFKMQNAAGHNWWGGFTQLSLSTPVLIDANTRYLKFMAYRSSQNFDFRVCFNVDGLDSHEESEQIFQGKLSQSATWEYVVIDLQSRAGKTLTSLVFICNTNWGANLGVDVLQMFDNFELSDNPNTPLSVQATAYPAEGGTVAGAGIYSADSSLSLTATANPDYTFAFWALANGTYVSSDINYVKDLTGETAKSLSYTAYFKKNSDVYPNVQVEGEHYVITPLENGQEIFRNRENMKIANLPVDFLTWKFVKISARSGYNPIGNGEAPSYKIKLNESGYVYAMVATNEQPANAQTWATDNGWELVPVYTATYKAGDPNGTISFYRKMFSSDDWYTMIFPDIFSRATLIFPDTFTTGIEENPISDKEVVSTALYTLTGAQVSTSAVMESGVYILKTIYSDGTSGSEKIMIPRTN